jgi:hypothetical protein
MAKSISVSEGANEMMLDGWGASVVVGAAVVSCVVPPVASELTAESSPHAEANTDSAARTRADEMSGRFMEYLL